MRKAIVLLFFALAANADPKNVHLLTGLTDTQLQRAMNLMRSSLGVHCDYCHVQKDGWNFASDEKPTKQRARDMIRLVTSINSTTFGGKPVVSCYTCHRGSIRPVTLVSLPQAAPPFPTPLPETPPLPDAKTVVAKYASALGDVARLALPRVLEGERITNTKELVRIPITVVEDGARVRITAAEPRVEQAVNETEAWVRDEKGVRAMPPSSEENFRALAAAYAVVLPSQLGESAKTIGKERIGEHDAWVIEQGPERFYFDEASGLLVRKVLLTPSPIGTIPQQTDYDDYRDVNGTKFPFRVSIALVDPWVSATRQYARVELGAKVDAEEFRKPD